jgi:hypothetical protein
MTSTAFMSSPQSFRERKMAQAESLRHLNFYLYFQNSKLDQGNRTFWEIYISVGIYELRGLRAEKGLDRFPEISRFRRLRSG